MINRPIWKLFRFRFLFEKIRLTSAEPSLCIEIIIFITIFTLCRFGNAPKRFQTCFCYVNVIIRNISRERERKSLTEICLYISKMMYLFSTVCISNKNASPKRCKPNTQALSSFKPLKADTTAKNYDIVYSYVEMKISNAFSFGILFFFSTQLFPY